MIEGLRRRFARSIDKDPWDADQDFQPEPNQMSDPSTDKAVFLAPTKVMNEVASNDIDMREYYMRVVQTAIQQGGTYHGQQMSVPWLRMILAGLEMRPFPPEALWNGDERNSLTQARSDVPDYGDLFPSEESSPPDSKQSVVQGSPYPGRQAR